jgi:hypothetical protein
MGELTTIPLQKNTREKLKTFGTKGETYDKIINRILESINYEEFMERQYKLLTQKDKFVPLDEI